MVSKTEARKTSLSVSVKFGRQQVRNVNFTYFNSDNSTKSSGTSKSQSSGSSGRMVEEKRWISLRAKILEFLEIHF